MPAMLTTRLVSGLVKKRPLVPRHHREAKTRSVTFLKLLLPRPRSHCFSSSSTLDTFIPTVPTTWKLCTITLYLWSLWSYPKGLVSPCMVDVAVNARELAHLGSASNLGRRLSVWECCRTQKDHSKIIGSHESG